MKHKRGKQNMAHRALKKDKRTGAFADEAAAAAFHAIFGEGRQGPPNETLAHQVLIDWVKLNADSEKSSGKKQHVDLTQYLVKKGTKQTTKKSSLRPFWDKEIFINKMKQLRGWSFEKAEGKFQELMADPHIEKDNGGPAGEERIEVPANLIGEDFSKSSRGEFEEKFLQTSTKGKKQMSQAEQDTMFQEMHQGFSHLGQVRHAQWHVPLAPTALTQLNPAEAGAASALDLLKSSAPNASTTSAAGNDSSEDATQAAEGLPGKPAEKGPSSSLKPVDLAVARPKVQRELYGELQECVKQMQLMLNTCHVQLDAADSLAEEDLVKVLIGRANVVHHFLGETTQPASLDCEVATSVEQLQMKPYVYLEKAFALAHACLRKSGGGARTCAFNEELGGACACVRCCALGRF